jgi:hypothetical protein
MLPPRPDEDVPDPIRIEPEFPELAVPLLTTNTPLLPDVPSLVWIRMPPLDVVPPPPKIDIWPPDANDE